MKEKMLKEYFNKHKSSKLKKKNSDKHLKRVNLIKLKIITPIKIQ